MNQSKKNSKFILAGTLTVIFSISAICQENPGAKSASQSDSLSLKPLIDQVISTHPTVKASEEALRNADTRIGLAKTSYYPFVDAGANFTNIGPVTKFTITDLGTFQLYPENNYSASVNYRQMIYDFGRTRTDIDIEKEGKILEEKTLEQVKQKMALATINNFYTLAFLQHAIKITDEQLSTLQAHLNYIETLKSTGSATDYQVLSTKVRISTAQSLKSDLVAALAIQQAYLCSLTGKSNWAPVVKEELDIPAPLVADDSLLNYAYNNRDEMAINREKVALAELRYKLIKTLNNPFINAVVSGGGKNGYLPDLSQVKANYVAGVGISVPIFDGMKTKYNLLQAKSVINSLNFEDEGTRRNITSDITEAKEYMIAAMQKEQQFALQLDQAQEAYSLAEISFRSGTITNLELLDANTDVSQSRLLLLKSRIDYAVSIYRLKAALGERLY